MLVMKKMLISLMVVFLIVFEMLFLATTARFVSYLERGFDAKTAMEWTERDLTIEKELEEKEPDSYPMANANISWVSMGRKP